MKRTALLAAGAATVIAAGTFVAVDVAVAAPSSHTVSLTSKPLKQKELGKSNEVEADVLSDGGSTVGFANESCNFGSTGDKCAVSFSLKGGILLGHYTFPISNGTAATTAKGKITGGLGAFAGDTGKIKVVATAKHATVTLTYS